MKWKLLTNEEIIILEAYKDGQIESNHVEHEFRQWFRDNDKLLAIHNKLIGVGYLKQDKDRPTSLFMSESGKAALTAINEDRLETLNKRKRIEELIELKLRRSREEQSKEFKEMKKEQDKRLANFHKTSTKKNYDQMFYIWFSIGASIINLLLTLYILSKG